MPEILLSRKERDKLRQRDEIFAAALALFSEKGFHQATMAEIAEKAEFAIGTLYKFFANKEDLYQALVLAQSRIFGAAFEHALDTPQDEVEKLRNYVRAKGEMFQSNLSFVRLFLAETRGISYSVTSSLNEELRRRYDKFLEKLALVFKQGIAKKRFRKIASPFELALAIDSAVNAFLLLAVENPEKHPYPKNPDAILNIFFHSLRVE